MTAMGVHYLIDFYGVEPLLISYAEMMQEVIGGVVKNNNFTVIGEKFNQFEPYGVSGIYLLAQSHISFHTWVVEGIMTLDIFTCGAEEDAIKAIEQMKVLFKPKRNTVKRVLRGDEEDV